MCRAIIEAEDAATQAEFSRRIDEANGLLEENGKESWELRG